MTDETMDNEAFGIDVISIAWDHDPDDENCELSIDIGHLDPFTAVGLMLSALHALRVACGMAELTGSQIEVEDDDE